MGKYRLTPLGVYTEIAMYKLKLTQKEFAEKIGVKQCTISRVICGQGNSHDKFISLACANMPECFEHEYVKQLDLRGRKSAKLNFQKMDKERKEEVIQNLNDVLY